MLSLRLKRSKQRHIILGNFYLNPTVRMLWYTTKIPLRNKAFISSATKNVDCWRTDNRCLSLGIPPPSKGASNHVVKPSSPGTGPIQWLLLVLFGNSSKGLFQLQSSLWDQMRPLMSLHQVQLLLPIWLPLSPQVLFLIQIFIAVSFLGNPK